MKFQRECLRLIYAIDSREKRSYLANIILANHDGKLKVCAGTSHAVVIFDVELEGKETPEVFDGVIIPLSVWSWLHKTIGKESHFKIKSIQGKFRAIVPKDKLDFKISIAPIDYARVLKFNREGLVPGDMLYSGHILKMLLKVLRQH